MARVAASHADKSTEKRRLAKPLVCCKRRKLIAGDGWPSTKTYLHRCIDVEKVCKLRRSVKNLGWSQRIPFLLIWRRLTLRILTLSWLRLRATTYNTNLARSRGALRVPPATWAFIRGIHAMSMSTSQWCTDT